MVKVAHFNVVFILAFVPLNHACWCEMVEVEQLCKWTKNYDFGTLKKLLKLGDFPSSGKIATKCSI